MNDEELLYYLYHTKKNFGGVEQLYSKAKIRHPSIKKTFVKEWLNKQKGYQLNKVKILSTLRLYKYQLDLLLAAINVPSFFQIRSSLIATES